MENGKLFSIGNNSTNSSMHLLHLWGSMYGNVFFYKYFFDLLYFINRHGICTRPIDAKWTKKFSWWSMGIYFTISHWIFTFMDSKVPLEKHCEYCSWNSFRFNLLYYKTIHLLRVLWRSLRIIWCIKCAN